MAKKSQLAALWITVVEN